jgi:hypothetical protein
LVIDFVCKKDHILLIYQEQRGFSLFLTRDQGRDSFPEEEVESS